LSERLGAGELARLVRERVTFIEVGRCSVTLPADLDVVIHGASTVSFDPPIDEAFRTNVSGGATLYTALPGSPHVVHISTAYVAGTRKGVVGEVALDHAVDWQLELEMALAARADVERESRRPEVLRRALTQAGDQHAKAGPQSTAADAERLRTEWVTPGTLVVPYGTISAVELSLTEVMDKIVVDDWGQATVGPFGALRRHVDHGLLTRARLHAELGEIVAGRRPGRERPDERILFWHRGLATTDVAVAHLAWRRAEAVGAGTLLTYRDDS